MAQLPSPPLQVALASLLSENSVHDANSLEANFDEELRCPATPQLRIKFPAATSSGSDTEAEPPPSSAQLPPAPPVDGGGGTGELVAGVRALSPPPNCAICLGRCKNKCFTDSCMHQFCFKCLCEWSKVKPECPLCKQTFKSIIHNVKSIDQFEEYVVQPPPQWGGAGRGLELPFMVDEASWNIVTRTANLVYAGGNSGGSTPGNSTPGQGGGLGGGLNVQNQFINRGELLDMYRQEHPNAILSSGTLSQLWRRYVYDRTLYALPVCDVTGRFRESSARYYRDNPAQVHRLLPFINRDVVCLLRNTEHDVSTVLERIHESLTLANILSPAFRRRLQPILDQKTPHFIHELHNFARSPYDMIGYDRAVQYSPHASDEIVIEFSSSESSEGDATSTTVATAVSEVAGVVPPAASAPPVLNMLSFSVSATSEGGEAPGVGASVSGAPTAQAAAMNLTTHNRSGRHVIIDLEDAAATSGGSGGGASSVIVARPLRYVHPVPTVTDNIDLASSSSSAGSSECEFVLERKPPHLRTPEMVSLNSESDSDVIFVEATGAPDGGDNSETAAAPGGSRGRTRRTGVKQERRRRTLTFDGIEGATTSAGLRSTGRKRRQKSLDADKRSLRRQQRQLRNGGGEGARPDALHDYTSTDSEEEEAPAAKTRRGRRATRRCTARRAKATARQATKATAGGKRKSAGAEATPVEKRRRVDPTSDSESSDEDEEERVCLRALQRRLEASKTECPQPPPNEGSASDDDGGGGDVAMPPGEEGQRLDSHVASSSEAGSETSNANHSHAATGHDSPAPPIDAVEGSTAYRGDSTAETLESGGDCSRSTKPKTPTIVPPSPTADGGGTDETRLDAVEEAGEETSTSMLAPPPTPKPRPSSRNSPTFSNDSNSSNGTSTSSSSSADVDVDADTSARATSPATSSTCGSASATADVDVDVGTAEDETHASWPEVGRGEAEEASDCSSATLREADNVNDEEEDEEEEEDQEDEEGEREEADAEAEETDVSEAAAELPAYNGENFRYDTKAIYTSDSSEENV